jgi:ubiquinone/menaquinone biosynthesis C-methylase UbiE
MNNNYLYPGEFARFYDIIYQNLREGVDNKFFLEKILNAGGNILEIGVGTGRFFMDALDKKANIYGIDVSPSMLEVLKQKLPQEHHHRISEQSIVDFSFDNKFNLIIAPFRVMMHVLDKEDQRKALNNVYRHLEESGAFIFDVFVPNPEHLVNGLDNVTDFEGEHQPGKKLKRIVSTTPDIVNQLINVTFRLEWEEEEIKKHEWKAPLRFFYRYELEHLVERSMFPSYEILGDYQGNPLDKNSKEFIVVCKK